jgi:ubiquinol-cytochrome c reductase cytochrome c1 subunit
MRFFLVIFLFLSTNLFSAEMSGEKMPKHDWSSDGITGTFDRGALQRGFKVYREVCASCHGLKHVSYRDLNFLGLTNDEIKSIAAEYELKDGPNDDGEMYMRFAKPSDKFVGPSFNSYSAAIDFISSLVNPRKLRSL